jgi:hypothetical protein
LIAGALSADEAHLSVNYEVNIDGDRIQGEIDGLVRCGDTALLIEAKSATMRPGARRGGEALLRHLRDTLAKAADQGTRAAAAFEREGTFKSDGRELVLGEDIHEVHPILVTLDDLSSVAPVLWQLEGSRVMPKAVSLPWVATLHELDLVTQTIEWPAQFIHFLRRRSRLNTFGRYLASDELDWWMHYLLHGLYFDDEDDPPGLVRFSSLTDPLDAWALNAQGLRQTPAPKPAMSLDAESRALLELICSERPGGWVSAACAFLEMNDAARKKIWKDVQRLRRRAAQRGRAQRATYGFSETQNPMLVCTLVVPDSDRREILTSLRHLVSERLGEHGAQTVLALGITSSSERLYEALIVVDREWRSST